MNEAKKIVLRNLAVSDKVKTNGAASESALNDLLAADFKPWDVVKLRGRTGRYRVYSRAGFGFIFACLDADNITSSELDEVSNIIERSS